VHEAAALVPDAHPHAHCRRLLAVPVVGAVAVAVANSTNRLTSNSLTWDSRVMRLHKYERVR
jgi:hypothetical protein